MTTCKKSFNFVKTLILDKEKKLYISYYFFCCDQKKTFSNLNMLMLTLMLSYIIFYNNGTNTYNISIHYLFTMTKYTMYLLMIWDFRFGEPEPGLLRGCRS